MPFDMTVLSTIDEHARRNARANGITDAEIIARLRRKGYKKPERAVKKYLHGEPGWMPDKVWQAIWELVVEQDAANAAGPN